VRTAGMRLVGPACLGVLNTNPHVSLNATLAGFRVPAGRLAIWSESGAIGIALLGHAAGRRLGVSSFASLGRRADVSTNDLLEIWEEDSRTAVLKLYVETVGNPERFARIARRVAQRKPILAIKGHRRPDPTRSEARSHTVAALRGDAVVDGLLYHGGVQRFRTGEELFNAAEFYDRQPLPLGRQIGIISNSVRVATLAADACTTRGLVVAQPAGRTQNPLVMHIRADHRDYVRAVRAIIETRASTRSSRSMQIRLVAIRTRFSMRSPEPLPSRASRSLPASSPPRVNCPPAFVEALMALRSRLAGRVGIELLAPAHGLAYRPIAVAEPVGLVEGWRFTLALIAADAGARPYQSGLRGRAGRGAWPRRRGRRGR
jgi:hypothetical protein